METYSDLLPMQIQDELLSLRDYTRRASFRIGDIALEVFHQNPTTLASRIWAAVGLYSGKSARTVREYGAVCEFYPNEIRALYDVLAFDHFRVAMRLGGRAMAALDWAVAQTDVWNRPATVDEMEAAFASGETPEEGEDQEEEAENPNARLLLMVRRMVEYLQIREVDLSRDLIVDGITVLSKMKSELESALVPSDFS